MKIQNIPNDWQGVAHRDTEKPERASSHSSLRQTHSVHGDQLDLSLSARATTSSDQTGPARETAIEEIPPTRVAEIQQRLAAGFYDLPTTLRATARQILDFYTG